MTERLEALLGKEVGRLSQHPTVTYLPQCFKLLAARPYINKLEITTTNIGNQSTLYWATNICNRFKPFVATISLGLGGAKLFPIACNCLAAQTKTRSQHHPPFILKHLRILTPKYQPSLRIDHIEILCF